MLSLTFNICNSGDYYKVRMNLLVFCVNHGSPGMLGRSLNYLHSDLSQNKILSNIITNPFDFIY